MRAVDQQGTVGKHFLVGVRLNQGFEFKLSIHYISFHTLQFGVCMTPQDSTGSGLSSTVALAVLRSDWGRLQVPVLKARNPINVVGEAPHKNWHLQGCYTYIYHDFSGRQTNATCA